MPVLPRFCLGSASVLRRLGSVSPAALFPLTPALSPEEREPRWPRYEPAGAHDMRKPGLASPSPWGEGRGEGELGRRTDAVGQNGFAMRETEPQILAALDRRSAPHLNSYKETTR